MWSDPSGDGHLKITKADPKDGIEYDLTFGGMPTIPGSIKFSPTDKSGDETKVAWFFEQDTGWNPVSRYFCNFFLDSMVGKDFETGLAGLKKRVEGGGGELKPSADVPAEDKPAAEAPAAEKPAKPAAPAKQD